MKPFEEQFTAWVDGQLTGTELESFEKELTAHPDAVAEKTDALRVRALLREHAAAPRLSNPDFFNLQITQRIAREESAPRSERAERAAPFWSIARLGWAGAFSLLTALVLFKTIIPTAGSTQASSSYFAQVVEAWPSDPTISATTVYNPKDDVTIVWLDGLDYIPASYALK